MSIKKKRILKVIIFPILVLAIIGYSLFVFVPKSPNSSDGSRFYMGKGYRFEDKNTIDTLMIGNSDAFAAFSPVKLFQNYGYTSYNGGVSKQSLSGMKYQLLDALDYQTPKVVILETDAIFYRNLTGYRYQIEKGIDFFMNYHVRWKNLRLEDFYKLPDYSSKDLLKGFLFRTTNVANQFPNYMGSINSLPEKIRSSGLDTLDDIIDICAKNSIKLIFMEFPSPCSWNYARHNAVKEYCDSKSIDFYDLNVIDFGLDPEKDYYDILKDNSGANHLNVFGAHKATTYVGNLLAKYNLADYRNDSTVNYSWNEAINHYRNLEKAAGIKN